MVFYRFAPAPSADVMKATFIAMWRLFHAIAFYPILIGLFILLYFKGAHWIFGVGIIAIILIFDPIWRVMAKNIFKMISKK